MILVKKHFFLRPYQAGEGGVSSVFHFKLLKIYKKNTKKELFSQQISFYIITLFTFKSQYNTFLFFENQNQNFQYLCLDAFVIISQGISTALYYIYLQLLKTLMRDHMHTKLKARDTLPWF